MIPEKNKACLTAVAEFRSISAIYDPDDPWPEYTRRLSDKAEEQIALSVEEQLTGFHPRHMPALEIRIPGSDLTEERRISIPSAIKAHFSDQARFSERLKRRTVRGGLREFRLTIGVCIPLFLGIIIASRYEHEPLAVLIQNVFVVFCWVVIWQPFQSLVFDRWSLSVRARVYQLIAGMEITVVGSDGLIPPAPGGERIQN